MRDKYLKIFDQIIFDQKKNRPTRDIRPKTNRPTKYSAEKYSTYKILDQQNNRPTKFSAKNESTNKIIRPRNIRPNNIQLRNILLIKYST